MKRLFKAILWITCYGGACWIGIKAKLGFDVLSQDHWKLLFDKSVHAHWPNDMAPKKIVCRVLLAFIIIGILGLSVVTKKKKKRIPVVLGELPDKQNFRPTPVASQGKVAAPAPQESALPPVPSLSGQNGPTPAPISNTPPVNLMGDIIRELTNIANTFEISVFPHVKLENTFTQLVVSDDETPLLLKILPQEGTWKVNLAEFPEDTQWGLNGEPPKSILKDIIQSTQTLARLEPDSRPASVIILANSTLDDADNVHTYLENNGIKVAYLHKSTEGIPSWNELLAEFYPPKNKEASDETNNAS